MNAECISLSSEITFHKTSPLQMKLRIASGQKRQVISLTHTHIHSSVTDNFVAIPANLNQAAATV